MIKAELKKVYLKDLSVILSNVFFELSTDNVYSVIGKNGAGKTTLLKCLTNLLIKNQYKIEGKVFFQDKDLLSASYGDLRIIRKKYIKYVFQDAINSFNPLKTFNYYFNRLTDNDDEIDQLLEYFLLPARHNLFKLYPYEVSGGMAQRIGFILALAAHPKILLLDEPTSGIDSAISNLFIEKITEFAKIKHGTVLLVTHDLSFVQKVSDKTAYMDNRKLTEFLPTRSFFSDLNNPVTEQLLNSYYQLTL